MNIINGLKTIKMKLTGSFYSDPSKNSLSELLKKDREWYKTPEANSHIPSLIDSIERAEWDRSVPRLALKILKKINKEWYKTDEAKSTIPHLISFMINYPSNVKRIANKYLNMIDKEWYKTPEAISSISGLAECLIDTCSTRRNDANRVLKKIGKPAIDEVISALSRWTHDENIDTRKALDNFKKRELIYWGKCKKKVLVI